MKEDSLTEMYTRIEESRDRQLDHILSFLRPKAESDRIIAGTVGLLERWRRGVKRGSLNDPLDPVKGEKTETN